MNRLCQHIVLWAGVMGLTACATTGPIDPSQDQGFFQTLRGTSGGYQQTIEGKKSELATEEEKGQQLKSRQGALKQELDQTSTTLAAMRQEISHLDQQIAKLQSRTARLRKRSSRSQTALANLQARLAKTRARSSRLDTDASISAKSEAALAKELQDLQTQAKELETLFDTLSN